MIVNWFKNHKLAAFLFIIIVWMWWSSNRGITPLLTRQYNSLSMEAAMPKSGGGIASSPRIGFMPPTQQDYAPAPDVNDRMVVQNSYLSLLVKNVREAVDQILLYTTTIGGYMVNSSLESPNEAPTATVTIRIPAKSLQNALEYMRGLSVKVVSENITGEDVTDQYVDLEARFATLYKTKMKFEEILDKAVQVQDILNVQRELINIQSQIDSIKGQQQYLSKSAQMAKVTIYISTDELALPYAPSDAWRPAVIFKQAVRSVIANIRELGNALIWIGVYAVVWVPVLIIAIVVRLKSKK